VGSASPRFGDGAPPGAQIGIVAGADRRDPEPAPEDISVCGAGSSTSLPVVIPLGAHGAPEEVAVCELCGLVSRLPRPDVCPACGGGYG
jgi:hypothetical protein